MLQKDERLKEKYLFDLAFKYGKVKKQKLFCKYFHLYYLTKKKDDDKLKSPKNAFVAGLKVDKRAVKRNLYKRRLKSAYQLIKKKLILGKKNNLSALIWIANPEIKSASFNEIKDLMEKMIKSLCTQA